MARPRTNHNFKKQELVEISFHLLMEKGYENTSIQDIMNAAQISKGAMYHYFSCKEDILDAVLNYIIDLEVQHFELILNDPTLSQLEKITAMTSINPSQSTEEVQQASAHITQRPDSIFEYRAKELSKSRTIPILADMIQKGVETGEFNTEYPEEMATFIYVSGQTLEEWLLHPTEQQILLKKIQAFVHLLTNCLGLKNDGADFLLKFFKDQFNVTV